MSAAGLGNIDNVRYLAEDCGANVDAADANGSTALIQAVLYDHIDILRYLAKECGANVDAAEANGSTALMHSTWYNFVEVTRCLAGECGADVNTFDADGNTALIKVSGQGNMDLAQYLAVNCGANANAASKSGTTALIEAAAEGHIDVIRFLAEECGAHVNSKNTKGKTALMKATANGYDEIVEYLAGDCGADVSATSNIGTTALMKAASKGFTEIVKYLVQQCGADVNAAREDGYTAFRIAAERDYQEIQRILTPIIPAKLVVDSSTSVISTSTLINSTSSWYIPPSEIEFLHFVKNGDIGGEYRVKWLDADAAVKLFLPEAVTATTFEKEVHLWHQLRHPNVIKMYGVCDVTPLPLRFFVCEYASNGSLIEYVKATPPAEQHVWSFLYQAALGLGYLHERGIVHGSLRCSNILIGSDGLSKLANFGRSSSTKKLHLDAASTSVGLLRWQAPEVVERNSPSFASDVYSLGMCILEAVTGEIPWRGCIEERNVILSKSMWFMNIEFCGPYCPPGDAHDLVWSMCAMNPDERASLSSVVQELERLACNESPAYSHLEPEPDNTFDDYRFGELSEAWMDIEMDLEKGNNNLHLQAFDDLKQVRGYLEKATYPSDVCAQVHTLLRDFRHMTTMSSEQARILQLAATRAPTSSIVAFRRSLQSLMEVLGVSPDTSINWKVQPSDQIEVFVSEASKTYVLLEGLKSQEERAAFLISLKAEMEQSSKYTPGQLDVLNKVYDDIVSELETDDLSELALEWFIPWYELVVDKYNSLDRGGFGSVFRAKWLDSDVVVKYLIGAGDEVDMSASMSLYSAVQSSNATPSTAQRAEMLAMFHREVDIWFRFSHPHVVRLFGACHVGRPFFVCEYATNRTLIGYLKKHPDELLGKVA